MKPGVGLCPVSIGRPVWFRAIQPPSLFKLAKPDEFFSALAGSCCATAERGDHHAVHAPVQNAKQRHLNSGGTDELCVQLRVFLRYGTGAAEFVWIDVAGALRVPLGLTLDQLSKTMLVLVTGVGAAIHIYSLGYMRDDEGKSRYFAALSFFMFAMLGIVLANNFVMLFIFWELVGFTSYVLIGHWFYRDAAAEAAKKAFITTRIGDFGFMIGILMIWMATGSVIFGEIAPRISSLSSHPTFITFAALLIFCGAVGKSAQFPLHVWLPDAMEGPTPVSALIHAATMVAAGVYMLVRVAFVIQTSQAALSVIAWVGTITAAMAALIAT